MLAFIYTHSNAVFDLSPNVFMLMRSLAVKSACLQQSREADGGPQGLCDPRIARLLRLSDLFQHRRCLSGQLCRLFGAWLLFAECLVQRQQGR